MTVFKCCLWSPCARGSARPGKTKTRPISASLTHHNVRVREAVDYVRSNCNPNCPTPRENAQCENPFEDPRNEYCKQDGDCPVTVIFDSPNLNWCGCATTPWADPNKQTMGYSGRCSQGAGDYYTKYLALAERICDAA